MCWGIISDLLDRVNAAAAAVVLSIKNKNVYRRTRTPLLSLAAGAVNYAASEKIRLLL